MLWRNPGYSKRNFRRPQILPQTIWNHRDPREEAHPATFGHQWLLQEEPTLSPHRALLKIRSPSPVPEQGLAAHWSPKRQRAQGQEEEPKTLIGLPHVDHGWQAKLEFNLSHLTPWAGRMGVAGDQSSPSDDPSVGARSGALRGVGNPEHNERQ